MKESMNKPRVAFVPCDDANLPHLQRLINSLRKFHSEEELPLIRYDLNNVQDPNKWYYATPMIARELLKEYDCVIKMDADMLITGDISAVWDGDFDLSVVQNSNPRDFQNYPYQLLTIDPLQYVNNGLVGIKNAELVEHWWKLCQGPLFPAFQMREQDILNILVLMNYNIKYLDASDKWYGLISKGYWPQIEVRDAGRLTLPKNDEWPVDSDKQIVCLHWGGGNDPAKGNYKIKFQPEVVKRLDELVKP